MFVLVGRLAAGLAGIVIAGLSLFVATWVLIAAGFTAHWPGTSDDWGGPATWGELAHEAFWTLTFASTDALVFAGAIALLGYATERRWPPWRTLRRVPLLAVFGTAGLMLLAIVSS
jgi:hypothetical protein